MGDDRKDTGALSRTPFGEQLIRQVARKLRDPPAELALEIRSRGRSFGLFILHKEYCGHGLWFNGTAFELCEVQDGEPSDPLATWETEGAFVEFWAAQSDFTCSGAAPHEPVLVAKDEWFVNNQRITRSRLENFIRWG